MSRARRLVLSSLLVVLGACDRNQPACEEQLTKQECVAAGPSCAFQPGGEVAIVDGECVSIEGEVGFCYGGESGSTASPWGFYEAATGRVFQFPNMPFNPPEGWAACSCSSFADEPEACKCIHSLICPGGDLDTDGSSSGGTSSGSSSGSGATMSGADSSSGS